MVKAATGKPEVFLAFLPAKTDMSINILAFTPVLEQFGAVFMFLEQLGTGKRNCVKTAQYA